MEQQQPPVNRILIIAAHPDDIEFGAAGSTVGWSESGIEVYYCIVTDGAAGSNDPDTDYVKLVERRREEQLRAAECVGVKEVRFLGYPDGMMEATLQLRKDLTRLIRELQPERVVITDPTMILLSEAGFDYINHPDHVAVATAALYAVFPSAETRPIFPELLVEGFEPHHVNELWLTMSDKPNAFVDITPHQDRKIAALMCHESQLGPEVAQMVTQFDEAVGKRAGVKYAEEFRVMRFYPPSTETTELKSE